MAVIPPPTLTTPPTSPDRSDRATFTARAIALDEFRKTTGTTEMQAALNNVAANATDAATSAAASASSAGASSASAAASAASVASAASTANVTAWNAATNYAIGINVFSPITFLTYRRRVAGVSATDPSADATNWALLTVANFPIQTVSTTTQAAFAGVHYSLTNAAATTVTAPSSALPSDSFMVSTDNNLETNVINWNGLKHQGIADATMNLDMNQVYKFVYISAVYGWRVTI